MDDVKQKACEVLRKVCDVAETRAPVLVDALHSAGLLRTGVERECVEACARYCRAADDPNKRSSWWQGPGSSGEQVYKAGRAALEAEKPMVRWEVDPQEDSIAGFIVRDTRPKWVRPTILQGLTEAQAKVVADALNAIEDRRAKPEDRSEARP